MLFFTSALYLGHVSVNFPLLRLVKGMSQRFGVYLLGADLRPLIAVKVGLDDTGFQIVRCTFLLPVTRPFPAFLFPQVHIGGEQTGEGGGAWRFRFGNSFFLRLPDFRNPFPQSFDGAADGGKQTVGGTDVPVEVADVRCDSPPLHLHDGWPHVDGRDDVKSLPLVGAEIDTHIA